MPKKKSKHPKHMTTAEAAKHLFHPNVIKHAQEQANPAKKKTASK